MDDGTVDAAEAAVVFSAAPFPMSLLERRPDGSVVVLAVNRTLADATGWDPGTIAGTPLSELYPADHAARTEGFIARLDRVGAVIDYRVSAEVATGRRVYDVRVVAVGERDGCLRAVAMSSDVTRREAAEAALEETQRLARIGHFSWNVETDDVAWTEQMYEIFGLPPGTPVTTDTGFALIDDEQRARAAIRDAVAEKRDYEVEFRFTRSDGERRVALARGRSVLDRDGTVVRVAGTTQDVTEQRAAAADARALESARARQAQALELNDDVLQGLATVRLALMQDEEELALEVLDRTLEAARGIISDLLRDRLDTGPIAGDLVRRAATRAGEEP